MAMASSNVTADIVEATEFPDLAERYQVRGVPKIVVNDRVEFVGAQPERYFLAAIRQAIETPAAGQPIGKDQQA
jgi:predicted DsbA family dithiol-disulfide isomerase